MLVDIWLVHLELYLYGSEDSDKVGKHQDGTVTQSVTVTRRNPTQSLTETTVSKIPKDNNNKVEEDQDILDYDDRKPSVVVFATAVNMTHQLVATTGNETQSLAATASNVAQSIAGTARNVAVDDDDQKPSDVVFATAGNGTHPLIATTGNDT
jgi:ribosomal protein L18